jgi:hypothetical protein
MWQQGQVFKLKAKQLPRASFVVRCACRLLWCRSLSWRACVLRLPARPPPARAHRRDQRRAPADTQQCKSVADVERHDGDVRGDSVGLEVDGVDAAVVVRVGDNGGRVVVDPVLVFVGSDGDP